MSRNARRMAVSLGTAVGAAAIAAAFSVGSAPVAGADVLGADAVSDLIGAADTHGLAAAAVTDAMALSYLIEAIDPNSFTAAGAPQDLLGEVGYFADTYFLGPTGLDAALAPYVEELVGTITAGAPTTYTPELSELVFALDPQAFTSATMLTPTDPLGELAYFTDTYFFGPFGIDNLIAPYVQELISEITASSASSIDASPAADLIAALDPGALADLAAPTATGVFDSALDGLLNSGLALF